MVNVEVIKERKELYGNNFPEIANLWSMYLGCEILPRDVAMMMALMKITRIMTSGDNDSEMDMQNYVWIAMHYDEYLALEKREF